MTESPSLSYVHALGALADRGLDAAEALRALVVLLRADRYIAFWAHLNDPSTPHPVRLAVSQAERFLELHEAARPAVRAADTPQRREEHTLFALLRACATPQTRRLAHRIEAALADLPAPPPSAGLPAENYVLSVRMVATAMAQANDLAGLAQLLAALESESQGATTPLVTSTSTTPHAAN